MRTLLLLGAALAFASGRAGAEGASLSSDEALPRAAADLDALILAARSPAPKPPEVCSALDFRGAAWPGSMTSDDRSALELALNVSGSFEGGDAWANLSDDFDGQGVSLGLLNQNLGQGSLQPMLIRLRDEHPGALKALAGPEHLSALLGMLSRWQDAARLESEPAPLSALDDPEENGGPQSVAADRASVLWAEANLYKGGAFEPVWKAELTALASSPEYVSIQIAAAERDHERALADEARAGVRELRAYLFLFDVQVQNGGLYPQDFDDYAAYLQRTPEAGSTAKLEELLNLRLRHVRKQYARDVRLRKLAVILGTGNVHGEARNLPLQYCYDGAWPYR
ncbi:MAG TPA: hypothetical protein VH309_04805 [Elusimicrobiota bacterium]|jgi:hypothetical protein|nr:hypothetical protein [Elusimicrobiota bacterium]